MRNIFLAFSLALLAMSCDKNDLPNKQDGDVDSLAATVFLDVSYGGNSQQKMDVYLPAMRDKNTRTLIIVHGGGWTAGDKSDFSAYVATFQKRLPDYAIVNLNYRLVTAQENYFPAQEEDLQAAMAFLMDKSDEYTVSKEYIYMGVSAGAHLAMLQAYKHSDQVQPTAVISFFGPVDLKRLWVNSDKSIPGVLQNITNSTLEGNPNIFEQSSPINYATANSAPTLLLHGDSDNIVPLEQAEMLHAKLNELGVVNDLVVYPGLGHDKWAQDKMEDAFNRAEAFIVSLEK